ncbi:UDP-glycosyltransferase UGT4 [Musca domestica]|nr:UDP-glycosyltransferase UGT4 [Musca domestica]
MFYNAVAFVLLAIAVGQRVQAARILSIFGHQGPSQYVFIEPLLEQLAERGHYVTSITNFEQNVKHGNLRSIVVSENKYLYEALQHATNKPFDKENFDTNGKIFTNGYEIATNILKNSMIRHIMQNERFDVILLDFIFCESLYGLVQHFDAPVVGVSTIGSTVSIDGLMGNSAPLSYVANLAMAHRYDENMTFWQRCLHIGLCFSLNILSL